jgi:NADH-quinone oxidoreductase subunit E
MLNKDEMYDINEELTHCPAKASAAVEALNIVQRYRGWVSDESLGEIARLLGMTPDELDAVATFYSFIFRKPVGKHVILVCDSISCWIMGYNPLLDILRMKLNIGFGETTVDKRFTLLPISCLGACDRAPAMMVDDDLHGPVTPEMMDAILERYQ